jgi:predicted exporter
MASVERYKRDILNLQEQNRQLAAQVKKLRADLKKDVSGAEHLRQLVVDKAAAEKSATEAHEALEAYRSREAKRQRVTAGAKK